MINTLLNHLRTFAPDSVDVPILQPADPFLETAGEDLRRRIFITRSNAGEVQCLRPEFTIPICLAHLESGKPSGRYAYGGTVFRQAREGASEFLQVGLEDLGNLNTAEADAACIADMMETLGLAKDASAKLVLGDQSLFAVVVESLKLPAPVARRLVRNFGSASVLDDLLNRLSSPASTSSNDDTATRLAAAGKEAQLIDHISSLMDHANIAPSSGRSPADIARRMIEKVAEGKFQLDRTSAQILREFLDFEAPLVEAHKHLKQFTEKTGIDFGEAGEVFDARVKELEKRDMSLDLMTYKASFGRNLEYYTGVLFEAEIGGETVAGGGRYDQLCSLLGSKEPIAAVGFSLALDRLEAVQ